jgi:hypothetical protein
VVAIDPETGRGFTKVLRESWICTTQAATHPGNQRFARHAGRHRPCSAMWHDRDATARAVLPNVVARHCRSALGGLLPARPDDALLAHEAFDCSDSDSLRERSRNLGESAVAMTGWRAGC